MSQDPTRAPKPPPFKIGTRLRCVRRGNSYTAAVGSPRDYDRHPEDWVQISGEGLEVTVEEVKPGRRGTGRQLIDDDGPMYYDEGEPIVDETRDGCSVFYVVANGCRHGRLIWAENKKGLEGDQVTTKTVRDPEHTTEPLRIGASMIVRALREEYKAHGRGGMLKLGRELFKGGPLTDAHIVEIGRGRATLRGYSPRISYHADPCVACGGLGSAEVGLGKADCPTCEGDGFAPPMADMPHKQEGYR